MTLPSPIETGAISGHFIDEAGRPLKGSVILRYGRQVLLAPGVTPPTTIIARTKAYTLDENGDLAAEDLVLSDSDGLRRKGFKIEAKFALEDQEGFKRPRPSVWFQLTKAEPEKDITLISSDEPDGGYPVFPELHGMGPGGASGQVWGKLSDTDYDADWIDQTGSGGVTQQELDDAIAPLYTVPDGGIPAETLSDPVRASLAKAESALQSVPAEYVDDDQLADTIAGITLQSLGAQPAGDYATLVAGHVPSEQMPLDPNSYGAATTGDLNNVFGIAMNAQTLAEGAVPSMFRLAPEHDTPEITFESFDIWSDSTPPGTSWYREKRVGAAEQVPPADQAATGDLDLTGSSHYRYHGFPSAPDYAPNSTRLVSTTVKPGGSSQFANWLFGWETITDSPTVRIVLNPVTTNGDLGFITVNGLRISERATLFPESAGDPHYAVLTFPDSRLRHINIEGLNQTQGRFGGVIIEDGYVLQKPTDRITRRVAFIGDSFVNGNGVGTDEASETETFVWRVAQFMDADEVIQAGVGGTGFVNGGGDGTAGLFINRVAPVLAMNPDVIVFSGGYNDTATGLAAAIAAALAAAKAQVTEVYLVYTGVDSGIADIYQTVADAQGVPFSWPDVATLPKLPDGIHPNWSGHQILAAEVWAELKQQRWAALHHTHVSADITDLQQVRVLAASDPDPAPGAPAGFYFKQLP